MVTDSAQTSSLSHAEALDSIAAVLPMNLREMLAEVLTDQNVQTLRHMVNEGAGEDILRALTSGLACLEAWAMAASGSPSPFRRRKPCC